MEKRLPWIVVTTGLLSGVLLATGHAFAGMLPAALALTACIAVRHQALRTR